MSVMARIHLPLPAAYLFETRLEVRIADINYGNHLANDAVLRLAQEARLRWLKTLGYRHELEIEGSGIVVADAAVSYRAEAFHGDELTMRLGIDDIGRRSFDLIYQLTDDNTGKEVARLKTGIVFFDYLARKVAPMPDAFAVKLHHIAKKEWSHETLLDQ
ncbi:thioesterase family protein [Chromobacterium sp. IIBBL 290-4]|uniref:acyl-CoA thioesterase n=1 Tax=Chromobacterium sp. IIBBL 290-4 TaxID=2953890 RepID=UPI0020B7B992|nr:thioesterase family protein [Chromobacterium sp. IIBBL 290-4]UTH73918.1 thioesterase family protein [Chromobacterium sp. IIBBL 290-4]